MKAKDYLMQVSKIDSMIKNKLIEKDQLYQMAQLSSPRMDSERVSSSGGSKDRIADMIIKYSDMDKEIDEYIQDLFYARKDVIKTIEQLDQVEYELLHLVYIQGKQLYEVPEYLGKSYSWATSVHGRALKNVQGILDRRVC